MGIAPEQFAAICDEAVSKNLSELIQSQILAMDDFLTFKKMMVKANMELEMEALRNNQRPYQTHPPWRGQKSLEILTPLSLVSLSQACPIDYEPR